MRTTMRFHDVDHYGEMPEFGFETTDQAAFPLAVPRVGELVTNKKGMRRLVIQVVYDYNHVIKSYESGKPYDIPVQAILVTVGDEGR